MEVIIIDSEALQLLIDKVVMRLKEQFKEEEKWIGEESCMNLLQIKSKTSLLKLRQSGAIRFSQPQKKIIVYDKSSINEYLEKHVKEKF